MERKYCEWRDIVMTRRFFFAFLASIFFGGFMELQTGITSRILYLLGTLPSSSLGSVKGADMRIVRSNIEIIFRRGHEQNLPRNPRLISRIGDSNLATFEVIVPEDGGDVINGANFSRYKFSATNGWGVKDLISENDYHETPIDREVTASNSAFAVVWVGTNDAVAGMDPDVFIQSYNNLLDRLTSLNVVPMPVLIQDVNVPGSTESNFVINRRVAEYNRLIAGASAERGLFPVDVNQALKSSSNLSNGGLAEDGVHLSQEGYDVFRQELSFVWMRVANRTVYSGFNTP